MKRILIIIMCVTLSSFLERVSAQQVALSTNLAGYLDFGTLNAEASVSLARRWTLVTSARYNPFSYNTSAPAEKQIHRKQIAFAAGARYWPWHVNSGWWTGSKAQYQQFNSGGLFSPETSEGERYGLTLSGGYTYMIAKGLNAEFGLSFWGGYENYTSYDCPVCGLTVGKGEKFFLLPDEAIISLVYLF